MKNNSIKAEWTAIFRNRKLLIPLIAILFIPVLYSGMFLWAFWDPYDRLGDLPVAIVNSDQGTSFEGEEMKLGNDLVEKLKDNDQFSFRFVDKKQAYRDLKGQKYYMLVEIPENFSSNATTLLEDEPQKLELLYVPNEGYNFLSAQIGETAIKEIKAAVSKEVTATYAEQMFDKVKEMADGLGTASDGATKLHDGSGKLVNGSKELKKNLDVLASKSIEFNEGVGKIQSGTQELANGSASLSNGLNQLGDGHKKLLEGAYTAQAGSSKLANGAKQVNEGIQKADQSLDPIISGTEQIYAGSAQLAEKLKDFQSGASNVSKGASDLHQGIQQMKEQVAGIDSVVADLPLPDEAKDQLANQLKSQLQEGMARLEAGSSALVQGTDQLQNSTGQLQAGAESITEKVGQLNEGQRQLKLGLDQLSAGSKELESGAGQLEAGQNQLASGMGVFGQKLTEAQAGAEKLQQGAGALNGGMGTLTDGSGKISDGSRKLADGSTSLVDGTEQLEQGTSEMQQKLAEAAEKSSAVQADDQTFDMMGEPVKVDKEEINHVPNYGTGFAPYFLSLGLFVGALLLSIVFPLREPAGQPRNGFTWFFAKFGVLAAVGVIQSLLAAAIMLFALKIEVQSVPLFLLTTVITSLGFIALIQLLVTILGDPGRFIAIIILILQLTTSAGTFPLELIPDALQAFNAALPMTYSVQAYKAVISSGDFSFMWQNLGVLSAYLIAFMAITLTYFVFKHKRHFGQQTHPPVEA